MGRSGSRQLSNSLVGKRIEIDRFGDWGDRRVDQIGPFGDQVDPFRKLGDCVAFQRAAIDDAGLQDGVADFGGVFVRQHVIVAEDDVAAGLLMPGDCADSSSGDPEVPHGTAGEQRPLPHAIPGQGMFGDASNKADINFVLGALADLLDHRLRMLKRATLQAHGYPDVAKSRSWAMPSATSGSALVIRSSENVVMEKPPAF